MNEFIMTHTVGEEVTTYKFESLASAKLFVEQIIIAQQKNLELKAIKNLKLSSWISTGDNWSYTFAVLDRNNKTYIHNFYIQEKKFYL